MALKETLDPGRIRVPEGVDALIVVPAYEDHDPMLHEEIHQFDVGRIQVLVLVYNEVTDTQEAVCGQRPGLDVVDALPNGLAREQARIGLRRPGVEGLELDLFCRRDRLLWRRDERQRR